VAEEWLYQLIREPGTIRPCARRIARNGDPRVERRSKRMVTALALVVVQSVLIDRVRQRISHSSSRSGAAKGYSPGTVSSRKPTPPALEVFTCTPNNVVRVWSPLWSLQVDADLKAEGH
jgi:hypothetical protein